MKPLNEECQLTRVPKKRGMGVLRSSQSCIMSGAEGHCSTYAFTFLEFVKFLSFRAQFLLISAHPSQLNGH